ncbi:DUF1349 domain-containing protein [Ectobacillus sp. JY-23]|uniref:DUF1349 domain-containing protein n=1 Tax=Ectobacillus sp. JY-23 TaxID=2933872 RepID=UPI001FF48790|nr:DUF1349 domain-containing protein [Ectobacillus sp. JY-23]UOY92545.1 DUF1349 domain-containing protein [Ectobacillus sp. JY-23]
MILFEDFKSHMDVRLRWFSPPKAYRIESNTLIIETEKGSDFWQKTHYGFEADNGHFLHCELRGNFRLTTKVRPKPLHRYDQVGVMVRFSTDTWIKASVEYIPAAPNKLGAVVTNHGYSDWSTQEMQDDTAELYFRISRIENDFYVDYSEDGEVWKQLRMAYLFADADKPILAGVYACSPQEEGYEAHVSFIQIEELSGDRTKVYG